jgi:hypothetical protein
MKKIVFAATAALFAIGATAAMAQTTTAPAATTPAPKVVAPLAKPPAAPAAAAATTTAKPAAAKKTVGVATTEIGKKCSADADAAGLKGKPRIAFRAKCKKEAAKAAKN